MDVQGKLLRFLDTRQFMPLGDTKHHKVDIRLIFATTTPVPRGNLQPPRNPGDPPRYNAAALEIMQEHNVAINDLYSLVLPRLEELQQPRNVHFHEAGHEVLARAVADSILSALRSAERIQATPPGSIQKAQAANGPR